MSKEIRKIILPAQDPEELIFQRRKDGYYDVTAKVYMVDPKDNSKVKMVYEQCIAKFPNWIYGGIPLEVVKQDKGELYNIIVPKDESKESAANEL